jgi:plastocyanin
LSRLRTPRRRVTLLIAAVVSSLLVLASASPAATDTGVQIVYRAYQPAQLTVVAGQTVTWRNSGLGPHTVTSDAGQFDSGTLQTGATFSYTFSAPGTYAYSCTIHPTMHGKIVVLAALPPGFPPGASLDAVLVHLSKKHTAHGSATLVRVQAARPGAKVLLQLQSPGGSSFATKLRAQLSAGGVTTFTLAASVQRRLRVVVQGPAGEAPLISKTVRPPV